MKIDFPHRQAAHCETGVTSNLLAFYGHQVSEAMVFGIGGGLFFCYMPWLRLGSLPLITFRTLPGLVFKRATRRLGLGIELRRFRAPGPAMAELDALLARGIPVGCLTGAWWLPYFPPALRFHFNAHNIVVYGKEGDNYLISDPVADRPVVCPAADLAKARFALGPMAPHGKMYHVTHVPPRLDLAPAIVKGIKDTCFSMLRLPIPVGVRGERFLARRLVGWPAKLGAETAAHWLGTLIRMQEEIGTGGAGFRFIFAAFLQEAAAVLDKPALLELSNRMTAIGDHWREFAVLAARHCKGRAAPGDSYATLAAVLDECGRREEVLYRDLRQAIR